MAANEQERPNVVLIVGDELKVKLKAFQKRTTPGSSSGTMNESLAQT